ncbi:type II and III secretion system protein family protein [Rhizobium sp.]|uniref:type II and III secretion system protein family protein n=1 Tax=Rhizobium sp. TaxID=391 RepID=UPI000E887143|nr:pilus assembly protein CpaC [Rhizobium sp.]
MPSLTRLLTLTALALALTLTGLPGERSSLWRDGLSARADQQALIRISQAGPGAHRTLKLGLNKAIVVDLPEDAHDILVADPSLADAVTRTSRRIYLFGKTVGQTNIFIFGADGREIVSLDLQIERDIDGLEANLKRFIADSNIKVEIISDNVVLTGTVRTPQDSSRAVALAQAFVKGGEATTRSATATSESSGDGAVAIYNEARQTSQIVNMLTIEGEDQVTLKITVAEVRREILKQLGFNTTLQNSISGNTVVTASNPADSTAISAAISTAIGKYSLAAVINAMEEAQVIKTLAEPTLTATSGQSATFSSGGELIRNINQANGSTTTQTYDYGIKLNFTPVVLSAGRISLKIDTEVSEPATSGSTSDFRKRQATTSVELPSGGSIALAGLISDNVEQQSTGVPGARSVPLLGALFRNKQYDRKETELVIIATPYLTRAVARNQLQRPDDNFNPPGDGAMYFLNRVNKVYGRKDADTTGAYHGTVGFIYK